MSQFFSAAYGDACLFTYDEMMETLRKYAQINIIKSTDTKEREDEVVSELEDEVNSYCCMLIRADHIGEISHDDLQKKPEGNRLGFRAFSPVTDDNIEGIYFTPLFRADGRLNIAETDENDKVTEYEEGDWLEDIRALYAYAIYSDKNRSSFKTFIENPYPTVESFIDEFKTKLGPYLPGDFDIKKHLGHISFAEYA